MITDLNRYRFVQIRGLIFYDCRAGQAIVKGVTFAAQESGENADDRTQ